MKSFDNAIKNLFDILAITDSVYSKDPVTLSDDNNTHSIKGMLKIPRFEGKFTPFTVERSVLRKRWFFIKSHPRLSLTTKHLDIKVDSRLKLTTNDVMNLNSLKEGVSLILEAHELIGDWLNRNTDSLKTYFDIIEEFGVSYNRGIDLDGRGNIEKVYLSYDPRSESIRFLSDIRYNTRRDYGLEASVEVNSIRGKISSIPTLLAYHKERFEEASDYFS